MSDKHKILVDGKNLSLTAGTGIATYARNLVSAIRRIGHAPDVLYGENFFYHPNSLIREMEFFDYERDLSRRAQLLSYLRLSLRSITGFNPHRIVLTDRVIRRNFESRLPDADAIWNIRLLYRYCETYYRLTGRFLTVENPMHAAVAHWTYPVPLRMRGAKNIYTIHDLVPIRLPFTTLDRKRGFLRMTREICRKADMIVTISDQSKKDIVQLGKAREGKVVNASQSVTIPSKFVGAPQDYLENSLEGLYDLEHKKYILFYGAIEPKKNVGRLIEAYLSSGLDIPLILAGKDGWLVENELKLLNSPAVKYLETNGTLTREKSRVRRIGYATFPQLVNLIRGARMVAFPSLYEGFGLPIVEGMICGTPVLTSNVGSTAEVAGDAGLLVDPYDPRSIRDGLITLANDGGKRDELIAKGFKRADLFSFDNYVRRLDEDVYGPLLSRSLSSSSE